MAAVDVSNATPTMIFDGNNSSEVEQVIIQNLGPNIIYVSTNPAVSTTTGVQVPITTGTITFIRPKGKIYAIAATAAQTSPNNTRVFPG